MTEDEMAGWHHRLNGHGFGWTLGVGDEQGGLACCSPWGHKELDTTERLNWTELFRKQSQNQENLHGILLRVEFTVGNFDFKHLNSASHSFPHVTTPSLLPKAYQCSPAALKTHSIPRPTSLYLNWLLPAFPAFSHSALPSVPPAIPA